MPETAHDDEYHRYPDGAEPMCTAYAPPGTWFPDSYLRARRREPNGRWTYFVMVHRRSGENIPMWLDQDFIKDVVDE